MKALETHPPTESYQEKPQATGKEGDCKELGTESHSAELHSSVREVIFKRTLTQNFYPELIKFCFIGMGLKYLPKIVFT